MDKKSTQIVNQFYNTDDVSMNDFLKCFVTKGSLEDYPAAQSIEKEVVIYDQATITNVFNSGEPALKLKSELNHCLSKGSGVFVIQGAFENTHIIDKANIVFKEIIKEEKEESKGQGDHFAKPGANERIWNSFQKMFEKDAATSIEYFANPILTFVSEAWLGLGFQMTAQVNIVKPDGAPQNAHRDYHFGFQSPEIVSKYPYNLHLMSQYMTLQGAIAHTDMPLESGPTRLLPHSQKYDLGYLAAGNQKIIEYFNQNHVSLPLKKGDAIFFNPAMFHAAGQNKSANDRSANLLQVSVSFGKAMESVDRGKIAELSYQEILSKTKANTLTKEELYSVIACIADGYSFPTNLDTDPPLGHAAPETMQAYFHRAIQEGEKFEEFVRTLSTMVHRRKS